MDASVELHLTDGDRPVFCTRVKLEVNGRAHENTILHAHARAVVDTHV